MIRSISEIKDISVIDQNLADNIYRANTIDYEEIAFGEGGFGSVHKVYSINGKNVNSFVLKIISNEEFQDHSYTTIKLLHAKISKQQFKTKIPIYHDIPELLGLPFMAFYGHDMIEDKQLVGLLMFDLNTLGYNDYSKDSFNTNQEIDFNSKFYLAYQLTRVVAFLHSISFIHSDINEQSIFINFKQNRLALIDFDSGFNFDKQSKATTIGKLSQWASSRLANLFKSKTNEYLDYKEKIADENFIITSAVMQLILNVMPYFFLIDNDDKTKKRYLRNNKWPNIDTQSDSFNIKNKKQHETLLNAMILLTESGFSELTSMFITTFNDGYLNDKKRLTADELMIVLKNCNVELENVPVISSFSSNKNSISIKGETVVFNAEFFRSDKVYLNNQLLSIGEFSLIQKLYDATEVILRVENDFGISEEKIDIEAKKIDPIISKFQPSKLIRNSIDPIILYWITEAATRVEITDINDELPLSGFKEVFPQDKVTYKLIAFGNFDQQVSQEIEIDIIKPTIRLFDWKINLDKGIDNVDLSWETEDASIVSISPRIGEQAPNGIYHIGIAEKTVFVLTAKGLFAEVKKDLEAAPFPIPLIEKLLIPEPIFESNIDITVTISDIVTRIPILSSVKVDNVLFNPINIEFDIQKLPEIESPKFVAANFEIIQKSKPRSFDKLFSKLKFNKKYEIKN